MKTRCWIWLELWNAEEAGSRFPSPSFRSPKRALPSPQGNLNPRSMPETKIQKKGTSPSFGAPPLVRVASRPENVYRTTHHEDMFQKHPLTRRSGVIPKSGALVDVPRQLGKGFDVGEMGLFRKVYLFFRIPRKGWSQVFWPWNRRMSGNWEPTSSSRGIKPTWHAARDGCFQNQDTTDP
jgi:hypothetical protein